MAGPVLTLMKSLKWIGTILLWAVAANLASAITLVQTSDAGYYNNSIGTVLNGTNGGESGPFPVSNDSSLNFSSAPDLSAASAALGDWLTNPLGLNANWTLMSSIPNSWTAGEEVAVIYQFDTLAATNVVASFGVDNGIYAWLNGVYLGGARRGGGVSLGEHIFNIGDLTAGTHFLQLILEDHGAVNGYAVNITADTFVPGPPPTSSVPDSGSWSLYLLATGLLVVMRRTLMRKAR